MSKRQANKRSVLLMRLSITASFQDRPYKRSKKIKLAMMTSQLMLKMNLKRTTENGDVDI